MALRTALTKRLGLRYPVIAAPLGRGSTPEFLGALAHQGAMGFVGLHMPEPEVRQILSGYIAATGASDRFGVNLTLIADQTHRLEAALEAGCRVVSLWQGDVAPYARRTKDAGAIVFWTVSGPRRRGACCRPWRGFCCRSGPRGWRSSRGEAPLMLYFRPLLTKRAAYPWWRQVA